MKNNKYPALKRLFQQYQAGKISQPEKTAIDDWFESHQEGHPVDLLNDPETEQRIYTELQGRIQQGMAPAQRVFKLWTPGTLLRAACIVGGLFLIAGLFYFPHSPIPVTRQQAYRTISTTNGQVKKIMLEDSTEVWLNSATSIRVALLKNDTSRLVYLDKGEAFFKVKHDKARPFSVVSANLITTDIGTAFNIRAYDLKKEYRVAVTDGKVDIRRVDRLGHIHMISTGLERGQVLSYNPATDKTQLLNKNAERISSWKSGSSIYVDGLTLTQIGEELSRHFNVSVTVTNPQFDSERYTFDFDNLNLNQVLQHLTLTAGISYSLDNNKLIINPSDKR